MEFSVSSSHKIFGNSDDVLLAVSSVLSLSIAHWSIFTPNTNKNGLSGFGNASTTSTLSGKDAVLDSAIFIGINEHVFLVTDSDSAFLSSLSVTSSSLHNSGVLIAWYLLEGSIFLEEIELVVGKLETLTSGPGGTIVTVNAPELVDVGDGPSVGGSVESVLNLMNVCIPRHFALFYR